MIHFWYLPILCCSKTFHNNHFFERPDKKKRLQKSLVLAVAAFQALFCVCNCSKPICLFWLEQKGLFLLSVEPISGQDEGCRGHKGCCHCPVVPASLLCYCTDTISGSWPPILSCPMLPAWGCLTCRASSASARAALGPGFLSHLLCAQLTQQQGELPTCTESPGEIVTLLTLGSTSRWAVISAKSPELCSSLHLNVSGALFSCLGVTD